MTFPKKIKKGTKSLSGGVLKNDFTFAFSTRVLQLLDSYPRASKIIPDLKPCFFFKFDQKINQKDLHQIAKITSSSKETGGNLVLMNEEEVQQVSQIKQLLSTSLPGHWIAFKVSSELQNNTSYNFSFQGQVPSAEGPRVASSISVNFSTYPLLYITSASPNTYSYKARPQGTWVVSFSNVLDQRTVTTKAISITPECKGLSITSSGGSITINNYSKENTTYRVHFKKSLRDIYGQSMSVPNCVDFKVGERIPAPSIRFIPFQKTKNNLNYNFIFKKNLAPLLVFAFSIPLFLHQSIELLFMSTKRYSLEYIKCLLKTMLVQAQLSHQVTTKLITAIH